MILEVTDVKHLHDYTLWLRFNNGNEGVVELSEELVGPVFEPLKEIELFKQVRVDPLLRTIVWSNHADLAPEFLRAKLEPLQTSLKAEDRVAEAVENQASYKTADDLQQAEADISEISEESKQALAALQRGILKAAAEHRRAGVPMVIWDKVNQKPMHVSAESVEAAIREGKSLS